MFSRSTNTSPVRTCSNIIVHPRILILVMTYSHVHLQIGQRQSTNCKSWILKFRLEYSSRVLNPKSAYYLTPINCWIRVIFWIAKRSRQNLIPTVWDSHCIWRKIEFQSENSQRTDVQARRPNDNFQKILTEFFEDLFNMVIIFVHSESWNIWNQDFLKIGFHLVQF